MRLLITIAGFALLLSACLAGDGEITSIVGGWSGEPDRRIAFAVGQDVVALRFDMRDDVSVVGTDPAGTGLVAVEGVGTVTRALAQNGDGQVLSVDLTGLDCAAS